jgi:hypothetical protein
MPPKQVSLRLVDDRLVRFTIFIWIVVATVICVRSFLMPERSSVYPIFRAAAQSWLRGEDTYRELLHDQYRYAPPATVLLVPFAALPDSLGGALWRLVGMAAYMGALLWWMRAVLPRQVSPREMAAISLLILMFSLSNLNNGQSNVLVLAAILATVAGVAERRWRLAAAAATLACVFKGYPLAIALLLAALFPRRFAGYFVVVLLLGLALPFFCQQPSYVVEQYHGWIDHFRRDTRQERDDGTYRDVRLLLRKGGITISDGSFLALQLGCGAGILSVCWLGRQSGWSRRQLLVTALDLGCCWMVLVGPATESCTYMLLAPSLAWSVFEAWQLPRNYSSLGFLMLGSALLLACSIACWFPGGRFVGSVGLHPLGGLFILAGFLLRIGASLRFSLAADELVSVRSCHVPKSIG